MTYEARIIINLEDIWNDGHGDDRISLRAMVILLIRCRRYLHLVVSENGHPPIPKDVMMYLTEKATLAYLYIHINDIYLSKEV